jgi:hypothetical protein
MAPPTAYLKNRSNTETVSLLPWHRLQKGNADQGLTATERRTGTEADMLSTKCTFNSRMSTMTGGIRDLLRMTGARAIRTDCAGLRVDLLESS